LRNFAKKSYAYAHFAEYFLLLFLLTWPWMEWTYARPTFTCDFNCILPERSAV